MKRFLLYAVTVLVICLCGCAKETVYTTKYVDNCVSTEFRQGPSNASTVLRDLKFGEIVSYEKDEKNGYSKVVYNGVTGYVLSAMLSEKKPAENITSIPEDNTVITNTSKNKYDYLISNFGAEYIEKHISTYIRPLYYKINDNMNLYSKNSSGSAISWYDNGRLCKKEFPQEAELKEKLERLATLDALLNMDKKGNDGVVMDEPDEADLPQKTKHREMER